MSHDQEHNSDPEGSRVGYILGNDYALPYLSKWSRELISGQEHGFANHVLRHLNCSYFSTPGQAPTLLSLKQHAQALLQAIALLSPASTITAGPVGMNEQEAKDAGLDRESLRLHEAMDFLSSLTQKYQNDDPDHHRRLNSLLNEVSGRSDTSGTQYHCALADCDAPRQPHDAGGEPNRIMPYASHHNLLMHANACLERLDHEMSAQGGLLSILPSLDAPGDEDQLRAARSTLLGQLLTFVQSLVGRMHELELHYANMADVLSGKAVVARQQLSSLGTDGRALGAPIAFPQDRWILANAGEDVLNYVHDLLDKSEAKLEVKNKVWKDGGVMSSTVPGSSRAGEREPRGIVHVDITTRYYRLQGQTATSEDKGTLFVVPAWAEHPAVKRTVEAETRPTVVTVPDPHVPERISVLQDKYELRIREGAKAMDENVRLNTLCRTLQKDVQTLKDDGERERRINQLLKDMVDEDTKALKERILELTVDFDQAKKDNQVAARRVWEHEAQWTKVKAERDLANDKIKKLTSELNRAKFLLEQER